MNVKKIALCAMLAAMCAVLGYTSVDLTVFKFTFEGLPVILAGLLFGPLGGMAVGFVGTFIYQILRYGFSYTTILWILPYVICGFIAGFYAWKCKYQPKSLGILIAAFICELVITLLNTGVIYLDSIIYNYYFPGIVTGSLAIRLASTAVKGVAFGLILPYIIKGARLAVLSERNC